jgi:hypothetical protein
MKTRIWLLLAALAVGCGDSNPVVVSTLDLDRPVDVSFACGGSARIGGTGDPVTTAQPLADCDAFAAAYQRTDPASTDSSLSYADTLAPEGQRNLRGDSTTSPSVAYYAFVLQSVPGTVAVATWDPKPTASMTGVDVQLQDVDKLTPGPSGIAIGDLPVGITSDRSGCYQITANAGSCDLSTLSVTSVLGVHPDPVVNRVDVVDAAGAKVRARAAAIVAQPQEAAIGDACPATPTGIIYVAYPDCHIVAAIDSSNGQIKNAISFDAAGVATVIPASAVSCPAQCGAGGAIAPGVRPTTIDLYHDVRVVEDAPSIETRRLAIGADNSNRITVVDLGTDYLPTATITQVALEESTPGTLGVHDVALSPQIGMGGDVSTSMGVPTETDAPGGQMQFVYAVASDGTVRVAEVLDERVECDTAIDPRFLVDQTDVRYLSCMPVGDPRNKPRRAGAVGPGIQLLGETRPTSVAFIHPTAAGTTSTPDLWIGHFAVITSSNGSIYLANVDDDNTYDVDDPTQPISRWIQLALPHQLRDRVPDRFARAEQKDPNDSSGTKIVPSCFIPGALPPTGTQSWSQGPHLFQDGTNPGVLQLVPPNAAVRIASSKRLELPTIHQVSCVDVNAPGGTPVNELAFSAPPEVRKAAFPDLRALRVDETWMIMWEGPLSNDTTQEAIDGPIIRIGEATVDGTGMRLSEKVHPYCAAGVEPYDEVIMRGCDPTTSGQCGLGEVCYRHPDSTTGLGSCLPVDQAEALSTPCRPYLVSSRHFAVTQVKSGELRVIGRRHVLRTTPLSGCSSVDQCSALAVFDARLEHEDQPKDDKDTDDVAAARAKTWACEADPSRPGPNQCVMTCAPDPDPTHMDPNGDKQCDAGSVCEAGRCVEGVVPPLQCLPGLQRYELHAGRAFSVVGSLTGYQHPLRVDPATDTCVRDPAANPLQIGRIPLTAPPCLGDKLVDLSPNPCSTVVSQTELQSNYDPGTCTPNKDVPTKLVTRDASAIRFRNPQMTFELVDLTYPGDAMCIQDRGGGLTDVPLVFPGYALQARIIAGFLPWLFSIGGQAYPVNVIRGPGQSIWIADEGDHLVDPSVGPSTSGRVYRFESDVNHVFNVLQ